MKKIKLSLMVWPVRLGFPFTLIELTRGCHPNFSPRVYWLSRSIYEEYTRIVAFWWIQSLSIYHPFSLTLFLSLLTRRRYPGLSETREVSSHDQIPLWNPGTNILPGLSRPGSVQEEFPLLLWIYKFDTLFTPSFLHIFDKSSLCLRNDFTYLDPRRPTWIL